MSKYAVTDVIKSVEHKFVKQWLRGTGNDAVFKEQSIGYYVVFTSCPASMYLGDSEPSLRAGDRVRLTIEKV